MAPKCAMAAGSRPSWDGSGRCRLEASSPESRLERKTNGTCESFSEHFAGQLCTYMGGGQAKWPFTRQKIHSFTLIKMRNKWYI